MIADFNSLYYNDIMHLCDCLGTIRREVEALAEALAGLKEEKEEDAFLRRGRVLRARSRRLAGMILKVLELFDSMD